MAPKRRAPLEPLRPGGGRARGAGLVIYGALVVLLAGVAVYMGMVEQRPLDSPYVIAPAVGAAWFGLRLFMTLAPRA